MFGHHHLDKVAGHSKAVTAAPKPDKSSQYISLMALVMMNVTIIGSVANDVQQAYYGLSSVTLFVIGAIVFFLPTGLVAAELASGWGQRGGIFRWVGEAMGPGLAFTCLLVLWFQTAINFGSGVATASTTIGFYTPDWDWAVNFMNHPKFQLFIILAWLAYYWVLTWISTKGVKAFARITKYGVLIGTFIPLAFMIVMCIVWLAQGNTPNVEVSPEAFNPFRDGIKLSTLSLAAGVFFSYAGIDMNAAHIKQLKNPQKEFPLSIFICMILTLVIFKTEELRSRFTHEPFSDDNGFVNPRYFLHVLSEKTNSDVYLSTEVGQNQIWCANNFKFTTPRSLLTSGGFGTMGYGLPAAIGASVAVSGQKPVIAVMGDGSFQMDLPEMGTMAQWDIPVKMVLFQNRRLGMVHEHQYLLYKSNYQAVNIDCKPDFDMLAKAYGIESGAVTQNSEVGEAIDKMMAAEGSYLLIVNVSPFEPTGDALNEATLPEKEDK